MVRGVGGANGRHPHESDGSDAGDVVLVDIPKSQESGPQSGPVTVPSRTGRAGRGAVRRFEPVGFRA